ncbi:MAG: hypothetical protein IPM16_12760 [Chloroflexi bacterium]|nr:hypothetical protein [Chloroflexota bacterium]
MPDTLIVFGHSSCPIVPVIRAVLEASKVEYEYIDIRSNPAARDQVKVINDGCESVPTLLFPDGTHLTEPSTIDLRAKLREWGRTVVQPDRQQLLTMLLYGWTLWSRSRDADNGTGSVQTDSRHSTVGIPTDAAAKEA